MTWDELFGKLKKYIYNTRLCIMNIMTIVLLLASFGGIFGLCLGGSIISLVEILYFATVRFFTRVIKANEEKEKQIMKIKSTKLFVGEHRTISSFNKY